MVRDHLSLPSSHENTHTRAAPLHCLNWYKGLTSIRNGQTMIPRNVRLLRDKSWQERCSNPKSGYCCTNLDEVPRGSGSIEGNGLNCEQAEEYAKTHHTNKDKEQRGTLDMKGHGEHDGTSSRRRYFSPQTNVRKELWSLRSRYRLHLTAAIPFWFLTSVSLRTLSHERLQESRVLGSVRFSFRVSDIVS